jgi:hypothetical protein
MDVKPARCQKVEDHATVFAGMPKNASAIARVHDSRAQSLDMEKR